MPSIENANAQADKLAFYVERVTLPIQGIAYEPSPYNAGERKYPAMRTLDIIGITFFEDKKYNILNYLLAWKNLVLDDAGNFGLPQNYKKAFQLDAFDETGQIARTFKYPYCSPTRIDSYEYDGTTTKPVQVNAYFEVDNSFKTNIGDVSVT